MPHSRSASAEFTHMRRSASAEFTELLRKASGAAKKARRNVFSFDISPDLRRPHILTSYRANHSLRDCLRSLFRLHNETFNVWSHLLGCAIFVALLGHVNSAPCDAERCPERWPLQVFCASALWCLSASVAWHLVGTANEAYTAALEVWDYVGIVALIVGSCTPVVFYGFGPAYSTTRWSYMLAITAIGAGIGVCSAYPWFDRWARTRICMYLALAFCGFGALLHAVVARDFAPETVALLVGVLKMGATYLGGVLLYATHFPEALVPRKFSRITDIWGSSHTVSASPASRRAPRLRRPVGLTRAPLVSLAAPAQLWHVAVLAAAVTHFQTVLALWHDTARRAAPLAAAVV